MQCICSSLTTSYICVTVTSCTTIHEQRALWLSIRAFYTHAIPCISPMPSTFRMLNIFSFTTCPHPSFTRAPVCPTYAYPLLYHLFAWSTKGNNPFACACTNKVILAAPFACKLERNVEFPFKRAHAFCNSTRDTGSLSCWSTPIEIISAPHTQNGHKRERHHRALFVGRRMCRRTILEYNIKTFFFPHHPEWCPAYACIARCIHLKLSCQ